MAEEVQIHPTETAPEAKTGLAHHVSDTTVLLGYTIPLPIYTVVYVILAAFTVIELIISSLPHGGLGTLILIAFSICKAILVMLFYMHLKDDNRLFAAAIALPLFLALVSSLFLLTVPIKGY